MCTIIEHNIAHNRPDNFPSYPPDNHHCIDDVYLTEETPLPTNDLDGLVTVSQIMAWGK